MPFNPKDPLSATNRILLELEKQSLDSKKVSRILNGSSLSYANKFLTRLWKKGYAEKTRIRVPQRGYSYYEYAITDVGIKKCNYLRQKGWS